jgi:hypothetical protein
VHARRRLALFVIAVGLAWPMRGAHAYDFTLDLRTIGQGYQVRGFAPNGENELLTRRRLTQYLNLGVFNIEPDSWHGDDWGTGAGARNVLYFDASLRFDSDFGGYTLGRPTGSDEIRELKQSQIDLLYAFIGGRNIGGRVDFMLGRQIHFDLVDFYSFDGADVLVRVARPFAVEAFGGTEVRGELPLSSPVYELDGTSAGSRDPATRPDQNSVLRPLAGAALVFGQGGDRDGGLPVTARLAYRRVWSATADQQPGEPATGVNAESLALTASAEWRRRVFVTGGVRYNILLAEFDDEQLALRVRIGQRQWLTAEHAYLAPTFDGDSIWNVFSTGAYRDLRATYELGVTEAVKLYARGFVRFFQDTGDEVDPSGRDLGAAAPGGRRAGGASAGVERRRDRTVLRADGYYDDGYGGLKLGLDASARWGPPPPLRTWELEGRLTAFRWRSDQQSVNDAGFVLGVQAGGRYELGNGIRLHLLGEDNVGTFYASQFRALAVVELDASL